MALADKGRRISSTAAVPPTAASPNRFGPALEKTYSKAPAGEPNVVSKTQAPVKPAPEQQLKPQTETKKSSGNNRHGKFNDGFWLIILIWCS